MGAQIAQHHTQLRRNTCEHRHRWRRRQRFKLYAAIGRLTISTRRDKWKRLRRLSASASGGQCQRHQIISRHRRADMAAYRGAHDADMRHHI